MTYGTLWLRLDAYSRPQDKRRCMGNDWNKKFRSQHSETTHSLLLLLRDVGIALKSLFDEVAQPDIGRVSIKAGMPVLAKRKRR